MTRQEFLKKEIESRLGEKHSSLHTDRTLDTEIVRHNGMVLHFNYNNLGTLWVIVEVDSKRVIEGTVATVLRVFENGFTIKG